MNKISILCLLLFTILFANAQDPGVEWFKCYGGSQNDQILSVEKVSYSSFILTGHTQSNDGDVHNKISVTGYDIWMVDVDSNGDTVRTKCLGTNQNEWGQCTRVTGDSGFVVGATAQHTNGFGNRDYYLLRVNKMLDTIW